MCERVGFSRRVSLRPTSAKQCRGRFYVALGVLQRSRVAVRIVVSMRSQLLHLGGCDVYPVDKSDLFFLAQGLHVCGAWSVVRLPLTFSLSFKVSESTKPKRYA